MVSSRTIRGMMKKQRRKCTAEFKARVALEAIRGIKTINDIATEFEIHLLLVSNWKKEMLDSLPSLFEKRNAKKGFQTEPKPIL